MRFDSVKDFFFAADPGEFSYLQCASCASLWLEHRPCGERLVAAYAKYYTHAQPMPNAGPGGVREALRGAYINARFGASSRMSDRFLAAALRLIGYNTSNIDEQYRFAPKAPARILDYGCGNGAYLLRMLPLGYNLDGAEFDSQLFDHLAARGIAIADVTTLDDGLWDREFDHVTLAHVLEHVPDPQALLRRLFKWLRVGGTLFVEVPNAEATGLSIFGKYWRGLEAPRHFSLPSQRGLLEALREAGFAIDRQHINRSARRWVWQESLSAAPDEERPAFTAMIAAAPPETATNTEFLTFIARRAA